MVPLGPGIEGMILNQVPTTEQSPAHSLSDEALKGETVLLYNEYIVYNVSQVKIKVCQLSANLIAIMMVSTWFSD